MEISAQICTQTGLEAFAHKQKEFLEGEIDAALHAVFRSINFSRKVAVGVASDPNDREYALVRDESCGHPLAFKRRRASWSRGRAAARTALERLGTTPETAVGRGEAGEPVWPFGIGGSITHCAHWSVAAAMQSSGSVSLGIDLEDIKRIQDFEIEKVVCRPAERDWVHEADNSLERLCMMFSAKEALYKSLFPSYRRYIDFSEVELFWCTEQRGFQALILPRHDTPAGIVSLIASRRFNNLIFSSAAYAS
jgi:enterobactin synthetase component D / holo-[acyl-carrier protein] synthase